jgi:glycosyltransferase involved in cell wall biosynthesis
MAQPHYILRPRPVPGLLTVVVPVYNEEEVIPLLLERLEKVLAAVGSPWEVILVNDGSSDRTIELLLAAAQRDARFKVISLARNFGHQIAATAGLDAARGDAVVLMDADLQDPPEAIYDMLQKYREGYDVVYARRVARRGETWFKRLTAWVFYRVMRFLVYPDLPADVGDFRLMSRRCLDALNTMRETQRFLRGMVAWVGFPQTAVAVVRSERAAGKSKYPLRKMLRFACTAAVSFSPVPLRLAFVLGVLLLSVGFLYAVWALVQLMLGVKLVRGWTSLVLINCLSSGAIMIAIGVLGEYVARIFEHVKARPLYLVEHSSVEESGRQAPPPSP